MPKTAVITGGSGGIGLATARIFLKNDWNVALLARSEHKLVAACEGRPNALPVTCDVTNEANVVDGFAKVKSHFGSVDLLFNNAGIFTPQARVDQVELSDWQASVDVNLTGMFLCAREAFRHMKDTGGRIVNNGSISASVPREGSVGYTATKHAITGLTKTISLDGRDLNICCGQIDIGNARTEMVERLIKAKGPVETMNVEDAARAVYQMAELPLDTNVLTMTIMANKMPFVGRG